MDISKALTTPGRLLYPKIAKKSRLDEFLGRRNHLKLMEERKIAQQVKTEEPNNEEENTDVENEEVDLEGDGGLEKQLNNMMCGKVTAPLNTAMQGVNREMLNSIAKKIQSLRLHYTSISKLGQNFQCYSKGCNTNSSTLTTSCYSPLCLQRNKVRRELLVLLKKANVHANASGLTKIPNLLTPPNKKPSILEQKLTEPQKPQISKSIPNEANFCKDFASAVSTAPNCNNEDLKSIYIPKKVEVKDEIPNEMDLEMNSSKEEDVKMKIDTPIVNKFKNESESDVDVDMDIMTPDDIKEMILGSAHSNKEMKGKSVTTTVTTQVTTTTQSTVVGTVVKSLSTSKTISDSVTVSSNSGKTVQTLNAKTTTYSAQQNRRFCAYRATIKREEKLIKAEHAEDGTERIYSVTNTEGKVYLKKVSMVSNDKKKKRQTIKYPVCSTFQTKKNFKSILVLPKHDVRKLARHAGRIQILGFHPMAKPNNAIWPYPCARPFFKTCWVYRTVNLKSLAAVALQLRILWACLRWDDMQVKPQNTDGKHQITTETEILSLELLKHKHTGPFLEKTQYLRRKVVIPLELPKTVRGKSF